MKKRVPPLVLKRILRLLKMEHAGVISEMETPGNLHDARECKICVFVCGVEELYL